jgi:hypothetical protein
MRESAKEMQQTITETKRLLAEFGRAMKRETEARRKMGYFETTTELSRAEYRRRQQSLTDAITALGRVEAWSDTNAT